jgi:protein-S-isoprenylcysteine O-methyltransferase Ste14
VRHPSYSGALLSFLGLGITLHDWASLVVLAIGVGGAFAYRIRVEERALLDALGEEYGAYAARTKRLVPFVF